MTRARVTETVIVGAGQAGLALSRVLTDAGRAHVVLERGRTGERWRSERWESLSLLTPAWASVLPGEGKPADPEAFETRDAFVERLERYAASFEAPVVGGVDVRSVARRGGGFDVATSAGVWRARNVVVATGDCGRPRVPAAAVPPGVLSLPSTRYVAPDRLPAGGVLVVGAGPTGQQLALELVRSGRPVTIAVGRHARLPRRYRGRDVWHWIHELGDFDMSIDEAPDPAAARRTPSVTLTGSNGGEDLDLGVLQRAGVRLAGRLRGIDGDRALFSDRLGEAIEDADRRMRRLLERMDSLADACGAPHESIADIVPERPPQELDLRAAGVGAVLWASGFERAYPWLRVPVLDGAGEIAHRHGITRVPGLYVLGLKFQRRRKSHFIGGVGEDAAFLAERIGERAERAASRRSRRARAFPSSVTAA